MYICICAAVTDGQLRARIGQGSPSLPELSDELGVCKGCGRCARAVSALLDGSERDAPVASVPCSA